MSIVQQCVCTDELWHTTSSPPIPPLNPDQCLHKVFVPSVRVCVVHLQNVQSEKVQPNIQFQHSVRSAAVSSAAWKWQHCKCICLVYCRKGKGYKSVCLFLCIWIYVCVYVFVPVNVCFQKSKYILGSMFVEKPVRGQCCWVLLTPGEPTQHRSTIFTLQIVSHFLLWFLPLPLAFAYFFTFFTQPLLLCICVFLAELSLYEQFKCVSTNIGLPCVFSIF